jgi:hypothetical protein
VGKSFSLPKLIILFMSNTSPISLRIASKTRCFETSGDSSYYYSNQLISNLAFLKIASSLGQQFSWPSKPPTPTPPLKQGSLFLAKANLKHSNLRLEPLINLKATPGKEWISANFKLVEKLTKSQQFFHCKALGLLAKTLGRCGRFNSLYQYNGVLQKLPFYTYKESSVFSMVAQPLEYNQNKLKSSKRASKDQKNFFSYFYASCLNPAFPLCFSANFFGLASQKDLATPTFAAETTKVKETPNSSLNQQQFFKTVDTFKEKTETASFGLWPFGLWPFGCLLPLRKQRSKSLQNNKQSSFLVRSWSKKLEKNTSPSLSFLLPLSKFNFASKKKSSFAFNAKSKLGVAFFKGAAYRKQASYQSKQKSLSKAADPFSFFFSATARRKSLLPSFSALQSAVKARQKNAAGENLNQTASTLYTDKVRGWLLRYNSNKENLKTKQAQNLLSSFWLLKKLASTKAAGVKAKTSVVPAFKTPTGLPFYLGCLGLISHCQVLKSSLAVAPLLSGSMKSNLLLADHSQVLKTTSSSGLGVVSASPQLFIARNHKHCTQYLFFRIPLKLAPCPRPFGLCFANRQSEKSFKKKTLANTVYLTGKLQGLQQKHSKRAKPFYASARWL